jgi:hypothetical protein
VFQRWDSFDGFFFRHFPARGAGPSAIGWERRENGTLLPNPSEAEVNECAEKEFIALICVVSVKHLAACIT